MKRHFVLAGIAAIGLALTATVAMAQAPILHWHKHARAASSANRPTAIWASCQARTISADLRGRVDQNNIQRRQLYTRRAAERSVSVNEMAAAVACEVFQRPRIAVGERYRNEAGQWRQRTAGAAIEVPSFCAE
jgi:type IV secretory pathway TrbL component